MDAMIGKTIGRYRITQHLGRGGMAEVYKAHQASLDRERGDQVDARLPGRRKQASWPASSVKRKSSPRCATPTSCKSTTSTPTTASTTW